MDELMPVLIVGILFIGLPGMIFHYVTQWKRMRTISGDDEQLLDDLHETARRLDARLHSIERILDAENPQWRREN
ncbi:envelope stress response membrane protein PspB [Parapedomonas caeni]